MKKPFTVVSTFAGCGGSSTGYEMAGGKVLLAVEWDVNAVECYRANHPSTVVHHGDIAALSDEEALRLAGIAPGELDIFDGSPPCQGFSSVGKREFSDSRNSLFRQFVRLLRAFKPRAFVMENVKGMVMGTMKLIFADAMRELKASGYRVSCRLLDAKWFGVPQLRERLIFIGVRDDIGIEPSHPKAMTRPISLKDVLPSLGGTRSLRINGWSRPESVAATLVATASGYQGIRSTKEFHRHKKFSKDDVGPTLTTDVSAYVLDDGFDRGKTSTDGPSRTLRSRRALKLVPVEAPTPELTGKYRKMWDRVSIGGSAADVTGSGGYSSCFNQDPSKPSPTLLKIQGWKGFDTVVHPLKARPLTIAEAKIISSFPPNYVLIGSYQQQWARISNSVPPLFMKAIAEHVRDHIIRLARAREKKMR